MRNLIVKKTVLAVVASVMLILASQGNAAASTLNVSLGELDVAIDQIDANPDAIERLVLERIEDALVEAELQFDAGQLIFSDTSENLIDDNSCTRTEIRTVTTTIALDSNTSFGLSLASINEPIELRLNIAASVAADGRAKQTLGFRLGGCQQLAEDNFSFSARGQIELSLGLRIELNAVLEPTLTRLSMRPQISLEGSLQSQDIKVDVDDSILRKAIEKLIEDEIDDALSGNELNNSLAELESDLSNDLEERLEQGVLIVELPEASDEQVSRLYTLLSPQGDFSLSLGLLRVKRLELIAALVTGDDDALSALLSTAAQCEAAGLLQTSLPVSATYHLSTGACEVLNQEQLSTALADGTQLYSDSQCQTAFDASATSELDYCAYVLDTNSLGNAAAKTDTLNRWTLSPGTRFDIGALPLAGSTQPFTQRVQYRQIATSQGECSLEMRIHSLAPDSNNVDEPVLKPLIAFHGGSWQRRSSGALGIEAFATPLVNEGYVVFAPFYRLIGTEEGSVECNNASLDDVLDDASAALEWVQENASRYGASGKPVVFGQSAGGHMAAVLAVEQPDDIASAVLFYAPTDFTNFANALLSGDIESETGQRILETVVGQTLETLDLNAPIIRRNTLTSRIVEPGASTPPFFLLQGLQDTVLPFEQSVRFCDALSGNPEAGSASLAVMIDSNSGSQRPLKRVVACGDDGSELHMITEGEHALDLCIADDLCLAGSPESAQKTRESVQRMLDWLAERDLQNALIASGDTNQADDDQQITGVATTGGLAYAISALMLLACLCRISRRTVLVSSQR